MDLEEWEDALPFFDDALVVLAETPGGDSPEMVHYPTLPCLHKRSALPPVQLWALHFLFYRFFVSSFSSFTLHLFSPPLHFPSSLSCLVLSCPVRLSATT
jgi:hypothetical protein